MSATRRSLRSSGRLALGGVVAAILCARSASGATPEWREISPPPAVHDHTLLFDEASGRLLSFGGWRGYQRGPLSDLWSFQPDAGWNRLPGKAPIPTRGANLILDTRRYRLVAFGS